MTKPGKPRANGTMTEPQFKSFIISALREKTKRWAPRSLALANARVRRGWYMCAECKQEVPSTTPAVYQSGKKKGVSYRRKNVLVDHIKPVVDPYRGWQSWDVYIERMFCELPNYQVLCHACHQVKCGEERAIRNAPKYYK